MIVAADKHLEENLKKRDEARKDLKSREEADPVDVEAAEKALLNQDLPIGLGVKRSG